ncbi:MAG: fluoride efflux transporter CrcB [Bacillota bacterium]|jgi:CrcB protein
MQSVFYVGLGGFVGSILRYGLGKIPVAVNFPIMTMVINLSGSFVIGLVSEFAKDRTAISPNVIFFLQAGFCGGFTTFSTLSLETVTMIQNNKYLAASTYVFLSVMLCLGGTIFGMFVARIIKSKYAL